MKHCPTCDCEQPANTLAVWPSQRGEDGWCNCCNADASGHTPQRHTITVRFGSNGGMLVRLCAPHALSLMKQIKNARWPR